MFQSQNNQFCPQTSGTKPTLLLLLLLSSSVRPHLGRHLSFPSSPDSLSLIFPPSRLPPPSLALCLCFTSYRVVPLLVSILFAASESISRNKNFTDPINYAHFIFITRLHRPRRRDNRLMRRMLSRDAAPAPPPPSSPLLPPPALH